MEMDLHQIIKSSRALPVLLVPVSHDPPKPTVEVEEQEEFLVDGCEVLNVVAV